MLNVRIMDLYQDVAARVSEVNASGRYESKSSLLWKWASARRGSFCRRLAFVMNKKTYKEWDRAEGCFGSGVSGEFWPLLNSPERYEAAYEALSDEESRQIFEWRLKVRLAMPFVMRWEDAYPAPKAPGLEGITLDGEEAVFCKGCNSGQYILNPYCQPEPGDVVWT